MNARTRGLPAIATSICLLLTATSNAAEPKEIRLAPQTKWLVDWAQDSCVLARRFGAGENPVLLSLRTYAPGYAFEVTIAGKPVVPLRERSDLTISAGSNEPFLIHGGGQTGTAEGYGTALVFSAIFGSADAELTERRGVSQVTTPAPYPDAALEQQLDHITIGSQSRRLVFETGAMAPAFKALRVCTDDLAKHLGVDPVSQHGLIRSVQSTNLRSWASEIQSIYPLRLARAGKGARVIVRVVADKEGKPTRCNFFQTFNNTDFAVRACDIIINKAKFMPALDKNGQPVPSIYSTAIIYRLN